MSVLNSCMYLKDWNENSDSIFFRYSRAANSVVSDGIWLVHTLMHVLITYKDDNNQLKIKVLEWSNIIQLYFRCSSEANSVVGGQMWQLIKLI